MTKKEEEKSPTAIKLGGGLRPLKKELFCGFPEGERQNKKSVFLTGMSAPLDFPAIFFMVGFLYFYILD